MKLANKAKAKKHGYGIYGSSYAFKLLKVAKIHKNAFHKTKQKQGQQDLIYKIKVFKQ